MFDGLDANTAFSIVSIDILDIDVGENIGARLQTDQANADTRVARAKAEVRRALAIALTQQMKAKVAESRALLVLAESEVPKALGDAFRNGTLRTKRNRLGTQRNPLAQPKGSDRTSPPTNKNDRGDRAWNPDPDKNEPTGPPSKDNPS
jgi:hypothetical protein